MAENKEAEKLQNPGENKTNADTDNAETTATKIAKKKVTKKRTAKKKVLKKRTATKKTVTKKIAAVEADARSAYKEKVKETGQVVVEAGDREERWEQGDSVISSEPSDTAAKGGIKDDTPVAKDPSELPREGKVTMSAEASKTTRSSAITGFWPKIILWVVVVLAAFMYIRSLAHKGQTVKRGESSTPAVVNQARLGTNTTPIEENKSPASDRAVSQSIHSEPSSVTKIGKVVVAKEAESENSPADSESLAEVSVRSSQAEDAVDSGDQQVSVGPGSALQKEMSQTVAAGLAWIQSNDSGKEPTAPAEGIEPDRSPVSAATTADQVAGHVPGGAADSQDQRMDKVSEIGVGSEQKIPTADKAVPPETSAATAFAKDSANTTPVAADAALNTEASTVDIAAALKAAPQQRNRREFIRDTGRPSFQELFGYERPKPPTRWQDRGSYVPLAPDSFEQHGYYPVPRPYLPMQPAWGGGTYPGQYGPYGNYGSYPVMPDWAPYQPYGYGPGY